MASHADTSSSHPLLSGALRRGKWTQEEEEYAASIIQHFLSGVLPLQYGTTLRGYIAQLLHCDPMRVSKKLVPGSVFVGVRIDPKIGRRSYYPCPADTPGLKERKEQAERHLARLRVAFVESIEREELHEQESKPVLRAVTVRHLSPLRRNLQRVPPADNSLAPRPFRAAKRAPPSLPSLSELLRQNRLRHPSVWPTTFAHEVIQQRTHASVFHYASPPRHSVAATYAANRSPVSPAWSDPSTQWRCATPPP